MSYERKDNKEKDSIRPFYCGTQYIDWQEKNCFKCKKYDDGIEEGSVKLYCEIDQALLLACIGDGYISNEMAGRMGYLDNEGAYNWGCPEIDRVEEEK